VQDEAGAFERHEDARELEDDLKVGPREGLHEASCPAWRLGPLRRLTRAVAAPRGSMPTAQRAAAAAAGAEAEARARGS
jgi:hypothetical protein